jgi:putative acetyltransferase
MSSHTPKYSLRTAAPDDFDTLFAIHRAALGNYVAATWGWDEQWQLAYFRDHFNSYERSIIEVGGKTIGFLDVVEREDCVSLENIEIIPAYQGRTIGTTIIRGLISRAEAMHAPLKLQVLKVNGRAQALYDRLGFRCIGDTKTHFFMEYPT